MYAERDMRKNDDIRVAKSRSRARITAALHDGELPWADEARKTILVERFVSWAITSKVAKKADKEVALNWRASFDGIYEVPGHTVHSFTFEAQRQYPDEYRLKMFLEMEVPLPEAGAPQEWKDALAIALCQIELLRERNAFLEGRLGSLSKAGRAARSTDV
ncbi:hypothetical protein [Lysobacter sp. TY2-98]|uniref:hypothetical protein n=1 Tax=Lysobacter sp. TY2-98 TaxID=2290922 RepID=UPI0013B3CE79|nr:hypothetical protein [Lysobacter sp. TY2-98]